uniref:Uncharacterized protein n=1 Tax=Amphimedon queenslandica TaxID=400682 RepID=A0A1X7VQZ8_AMPQE
MSYSQEDAREARQLLRNELDGKRRNETEEEERGGLIEMLEVEDHLTGERARIRRIREQEGPAEREQRFAVHRVWASLRREEEDSAEREQRLAGDRAQVTLRREQEDPAERKQRLAGDRARVTLRREEKDSAEREQRLADSLASLPDDGDLSDIRSVQPVQSEAEVTSGEATCTSKDHYSSSFVPNAAPPATERETIQQALGQSQSSTLMWPSVGGTPINEFTTEG